MTPPPTTMASTISTISSLLLLLLPLLSATTPSPYLSSTTLFHNYQTMFSSFKIFIYNPPTPTPITFPDGPASLFYNSLLNSPFITQDPSQAHLFFLPFSPSTSTRSLGRLIKDLRTNHPFWNRTLGADHFFLSPSGIDYSSDRNVLELKKNAVQVSLFPVTSGFFIPHKDISLPPFKTPFHELNGETPPTSSFLGFLKWDGETELSLVNEMKSDVDFLVVEEESSEPESGPHVGIGYMQKKSRFCLFLYNGDVSGIVEAMASGCVPVVIVDRPIQDLPLMDVLRWSEMTWIVAPRRGGVRRLKELLSSVSEENYAVMRELGVAASRHLVWNAEPQPLDAFHMVMYQLWLRRHVIRYARRESA